MSAVAGAVNSVKLPQYVDAKITALASRIAGNESDSTVIANALKGLTLAEVKEIDDFMSFHRANDTNGFFTSKGLQEFRTAITADGSSLDAKKLKAAFDSVTRGLANSSQVEADVTNGIEKFADEGVWDTHIRGMIKVEGTTQKVLTQVNPPVPGDLAQKTYDTLSESWGEDGVKMDQDSEEFKERCSLLVLAKGPMFLDVLCQSELVDSDILTGIDKQLDKLMETIHDPYKFFGSLDTKKVNEDWSEFVKYMSSLPNSENGLWADNVQAIKDIAPAFIIAFANEAARQETRQEKGTTIGAWAINTIFANGERNMAGIHGNQNDYDVFSKVFKEGFLTFANSNNITGKVVFRDQKELDGYQEIFKTNGQAKAFFKNHEGFHSYLQSIYSGVDDLKLLNLFILDLQKADVIEMEDTDREWSKFWEEAKLGALLNEAANKIEAKYGKKEEGLTHLKIPTTLKIEEILTEEFSKGLSKDKDRIYNTSRLALKEKVKPEDVAGKLVGIMRKREFSIAKAQGILGLPVDSDTNGNTGVNLVEELMDVLYGKETSESRYFLRTGSDTAVDVAKKMVAGIEYLVDEQFEKDGNSTIASDSTKKGVERLTETQYKKLKIAMEESTVTSTTSATGQATGQNQQAMQAAAKAAGLQL